MIRLVLTRSFAADLGLLLLRVFTGALLIHHGYEKLANIENFADAFVRPLHLPFPILLSYVAAFSEVIGSWLLITGLLTRVGAMGLEPSVSRSITPSSRRVSTSICLSCWVFTSLPLLPCCVVVLAFSRLMS